VRQAGRSLTASSCKLDFGRKVQRSRGLLMQAGIEGSNRNPGAESKVGRGMSL